MLPFVLKRLLKGIGEQKTKNISLTAFPTNKADISNIFLNFVRDRKKQLTTIGADIISYDEVVKSGGLKELNFGFTDINRKHTEPFGYMFNHDIYLYATLNHGITVPIEHISRIEMASTVLRAPVMCNGTKYYDQYGLVHKKDGVNEFHFGKSSVYIIDTRNHHGKFNFTLAGNLSERITDESFIIDAIESGSFSINGVEISLSSSNQEEIDSFQIEDRRVHLQQLRRIKKVLLQLKVSEELDCDNLTENDLQNLNMLVVVFDEHKPVSINVLPDSPPFGHLTVANLKIMLSFIKDLDSGLHRLYSFFDSPLDFRATDEDGNEIKSSVYVLLNKENFITLNNIDYDALFSAITSVPCSEIYYGQVTQLLLEMLLAYDEKKPEDKRLLRYSHMIAEWLLSDDNETPYEIRQLNYLQIIKREREFSVEELKELYSIIESGSVREDILVGTYLLLDNQSAAEVHFERLEQEPQNNFKRYPIYRFWNKTKEDKKTNE